MYFNDIEVVYVTICLEVQPTVQGIESFSAHTRTVNFQCNPGFCLIIWRSVSLLIGNFLTNGPYLVWIFQFFALTDISSHLLMEPWLLRMVIDRQLYALLKSQFDLTGTTRCPFMGVTCEIILERSHALKSTLLPVACSVRDRKSVV